MSKLLGLAGLFILTRELTKGVSPDTVGPSTPTNGTFGLSDPALQESEAARIAKEKRLAEERKRQDEIERQRQLRIAEEESVARQRERDRIAAEEKKRLDNLFFAQQAEIKANPPDCGSGRSPRLRGAGTREFPYSWECILTGF
jgi:hypothetical protein